MTESERLRLRRSVQPPLDTSAPAQAEGRARQALRDLSAYSTAGTATIVFAATFLFRWITIDFDNDYFMHMAWAAEMVRGSRPVRDFVEPGFPAQTFLAYVGLRLWGHQLAWESVIACGFIAAGAALTYLVCRVVGVPRWLALTVVLIVVATFPRMYAYPKAFAYPAALYALVQYLQHPSRRSLLFVAATTAVAFLFRHDHGVWIAIATVLSLALYHRSDPKMLVRSVLGYGCVAALLITPWLAWVALSGHADQYLEFLAGQSSSLTTRERSPEQRFNVDWSRPLFSLAPIEYPVVGIRWAPSASESVRRRTEASFGLRPVPGTEDEYQLIDLSSHNVGALISDPAVEDTRGIDRGTLRVPPGAFRWIYLKAQRYVPPLRFRPFPGIINRTNAESWLTWLTFLMPWVVLVAELTRTFVKRVTVSTDQVSLSLVIPSAVLSVITYQTLVRASPDSRLGDVAAVTAFLMAWIVFRAWSLNGWTGRLVKSVAIVLLSLTIASAFAYGRVVTRINAAGVDGPVNLVRRVSAQGAIYGSRPLDLFAPPGAGGVAGLSRWINECTTETDRVSVVGFEPQVFFLSERGFAGGVAFYDQGWSTSARDQSLTIDRWSRQRVPVILAMESEWTAFSQDHPALRAWLDERYEPIERSNFGGNKTLTILKDKSYLPVRTHAATGLPCFR
jgi:hypothetical protein